MLPKAYISFIRNCLIANNTRSTASRGGGLHIASTASVSCCTIVSNYAKSGTPGSGVRIQTGTTNIVMSSCVIYSNGINGADDVCDSTLPAHNNALQYSCVGTNPGFTGAGIIVTSPQFKDFAGGDYHLVPSSPCINRGFNEGWMTNAADLDEHSRIRYGTVDMGAYEAIYSGMIFRIY